MKGKTDYLKESTKDFFPKKGSSFHIKVLRKPVLDAENLSKL